MQKINRRVASLTALATTLEPNLLLQLLAIAWRILVSMVAFTRAEITPVSFEKFERRLEKLSRALGRLLLEYVVNHVESRQRPCSVRFEDRNFRPNRRTTHTMETRLGTVKYKRWFFQAELSFFVRGIAPLDLRLGLINGKLSPGLTHKVGQLAADMPQQAARDQIRDQFGVRISVDAYRQALETLGCEIKYRHDDAAVEQLVEWIKKASKKRGKYKVMLLVGRDGVMVPLRKGWKEAACATLAVYDRKRKRMGTIYLGEMPQADQVNLNRRLTKTIHSLLSKIGKLDIQLRYVTDAGNAPRGYFYKVLSTMRHPCTGKELSWSWGVDFYHACEHLSKLSDSLWGTGSAKSQEWFKSQRHALRHHRKGAIQVIARAVQIKRRHGLRGEFKEFRAAKDYFIRYKRHMDYADRKALGDPIGSGVTEAGCKVIFGQRLKQSGMRWSRRGGQTIVDLRTAVRSGIWDRIWRMWQADSIELPDINQVPLRTKLKAA